MLREGDERDAHQEQARQLELEAEALGSAPVDPRADERHRNDKRDHDAEGLFPTHLGNQGKAGQEQASGQPPSPFCGVCGNRPRVKVSVAPTFDGKIVTHGFGLTARAGSSREPSAGSRSALPPH
jgi:hypothetical protein